METFIFNLNKNQIYKKLKPNSSVFCSDSYGPHTIYFGCGGTNSLKSIKHFGNLINNFYDRGSEILPSNNQIKEYDLLETEVYQILAI